MLLLPSLTLARTLEVGPDKDYATPCEAAAIAADGDEVVIDAGTYTGDVCAWTADNLTISGTGGYATLDAAGEASGGKAIWVIQGDNTTVERIEFTGATVPDQNGAGIRQEGANLTVRNCWFHDNENGILAGDNAESDISITYSVFENNGYGDGQSHNLYINHVRSLLFMFNHTHHAYIGHTLKSRAAETRVLYNVIADGEDGRASYQIDLPNGGLALVIGNVIQQGPAAENGGMVSFAAEGATNEQQALYVVNNTFVNDRGSGTFIRNAASTDAFVVNNLFVGGGTVLDGPGKPYSNLEPTSPTFVDADTGDYHLLGTSEAIDGGFTPTALPGGESLVPTYEPGIDGPETRLTIEELDIGAYEYNPDPADTDTDTDTDTDSDTDSDTDADTDTDTDDPEGCGCDTGGGEAWILGLLAVGFARRR